VFKHYKPGVTKRKYITIARLVDETEDTLLISTAVCCATDQPNKKRGYQVAVGRLFAMLKKLKKEIPTESHQGQANV